MNDDFQAIKDEFEKHGEEAGEGIAQAMYVALSQRLAPYFFNLDDINKRRFLIKLDEGEKEIGTRQKYDWFAALSRSKP
ncbi:hypothetical protein RTE01_09670 [Raoultella terrigena]|uniref:Uncharacterized protein n=1 Tax=Raoultella terrigena TaxID=577 RepID=A0A485BCF0_RAOTE|nr:hypothetical protein [Raoultella terrigena]GEC66332.1 hypothetical protein RTE01_09670 [Raoultella terrigena]VFS70830.1 Uncharacterised protein [Raoultella terrigena]